MSAYMFFVVSRNNCITHLKFKSSKRVSCVPRVRKNESEDVAFIDALSFIADNAWNENGTDVKNRNASTEFVGENCSEWPELIVDKLTLTILRQWRLSNIEPTNVVLIGRLVRAFKLVKSSNNDDEFSGEDSDQFNALWETLKAMGIDNSEMGMQILEADTTDFEMFQDANCGRKGSTSPVARLKVAWEILKGNDPFANKEKEQPQAASTAMIQKPIGQWSDLELLEVYKQEGPIDVEQHLLKVTKGRHAIILTDSGEVDVEKSLYLVRKARNQPTPATYPIQNKLHKVYRVGEWPVKALYECPVHSDVLLMDGYCDECGYQYDVDDRDKQVFLRLICKHNSKVDIRQYRTKPLDELQMLFPKIALLYQDLKDEDNLPSLKRKLAVNKGNDPFRVVQSTDHRIY